MLNRVEYQVQTYHCVFFLLFFLHAYTLFINKSYSNEKLKRMNKIPQITNEHMKPLSHETTFHAKVSKSIPNDGMQRVIRLPYMHQYVKNQHSQ